MQVAVRSPTCVPGAVELRIVFTPAPGRVVDDRFGPATRLDVSASPPGAAGRRRGGSTDLTRTLRLADPGTRGPANGVLHVSAQAASCDCDGDARSPTRPATSAARTGASPFASSPVAPDRTRTRPARLSGSGQTGRAWPPSDRSTRRATQGGLVGVGPAVRAQPTRRAAVLGVELVEEALDRGRPRPVPVDVAESRVVRVGRRAAKPGQDGLDPLGAGHVVGHDLRPRHPNGDSASATTTPVRSLPAAQCTSVAPLGRAISRSAVSTESGRSSGSAGRCAARWPGPVRSPGPATAAPPVWATRPRWGRSRLGLREQRQVVDGDAVLVGQRAVTLGAHLDPGAQVDDGIQAEVVDQMAHVARAQAHRAVRTQQPPGRTGRRRRPVAPRRRGRWRRRPGPASAVRSRSSP